MAEGLKVDRLTVGYRAFGVFEDLDLPLMERARIVGLLGPNAAGKSTLLKAVAGLTPCRGHVELDGTDVSDLTAAERARRIAYLPQAVPASAALTVYEAVLGARRATARGWHATAQDIDAVGAVLARLEIEDLALRDLGALSGGQRQLVGLAQAMVREPEVYLLDEPTSALDLRRQIAVLEFVRAEVERRRAVAVVALHDVNLALRFTDAVIVVAKGRLAAAGEVDRVLGRDVMAEVYGVEARLEQCSQGRPVLLVDGRSRSVEADAARLAAE